MPPDFDQFIDRSATSVCGAAGALKLGFEKAVRAAPINRPVNAWKAEFQKFLEIDIQRGFPRAVIVAHWLFGHGCSLQSNYTTLDCVISGTMAHTCDARSSPRRHPFQRAARAATRRAP